MSLPYQSTIQKLAKQKNSSVPILSVYVDISHLQKPFTATLRRHFRELVKKSLSRAEQKSLLKNLEYVDGYLEEFNNHKSAKGLAIFSGGERLWEVIQSKDVLPNLLKVNHTPYLLPLLQKENNSKRYLVIIIDREKARFFTVSHNVLELIENIDNRDFVPQKMKGRNVDTRSGKIDRHIQDHLHRHFKMVVGKLNVFTQNLPIAAVIIGGHKELLHTFEKELPKRFGEKIIGEFHAEPDEAIDFQITRVKNILEEKTSHEPLFV